MSPSLPRPPANLLDIRGERYGRLTVTERVIGGWLCRCDCGSLKTFKSWNLRNGKSTSCGCVRREMIAALRRTHGARRRPEYTIWANIKARCTNPKASGFNDYGARGIKICDRWLNSFEVFFADMGPRPSSQHSIDRIDNNQDYEPSNCRWATRIVQNRNSRRNLVAVINGKRVLLADASRNLGLNISSIKSRIANGWSIERAFTEPKRR